MTCQCHDGSVLLEIHQAIMDFASRRHHPMNICEGSPSRENGSCNGKAKSASTKQPEILAPEQTDAFGPRSSLHDYCISFWAYCTASGRTFLLGPDGITTGSTLGYFQSLAGLWSMTIETLSPSHQPPRPKTDPATPRQFSARTLAEVTSPALLF
jgi:hypothetical protein